MNNNYCKKCRVQWDSDFQSHECPSSVATPCSAAHPIPFDDQEKQIGRVLYEVEAILANCRDQEGWRFKAIREAAERIEAVFAPPTDPPHEEPSPFRRSETRIRRELKSLREFIESPESDQLAVRIAQVVEDSVRWMTEDMRGMCDRVTDAVSMAGMIRAEVERGTIDIEVQ